MTTHRGWARVAAMLAGLAGFPGNGAAAPISARMRVSVHVVRSVVVPEGRRTIARRLADAQLVSGGELVLDQHGAPSPIFLRFPWPAPSGALWVTILADGAAEGAAAVTAEDAASGGAARPLAPARPDGAPGVSATGG